MEDESEEEDLDGDERAKREEEQIEMDEVIHHRMGMEIREREAEGDREGFEVGSKYRLEFNIWKTENDWKNLT